MSVKAKFPNNVGELLRTHRMTASALARELKTHRQNVQRWISGERRPPIEMARAISAMFGVSLDQVYSSDLETGHGRAVPSSGQPGLQPLVSAGAKSATKDPGKTIFTSVPVVGAVAAGVWLEHDHALPREIISVPVVYGEFEEFEQRAYQVVGVSMDKLHIIDGDYVIAVPYFEARRELTDGDIVVVEQTLDGGYLERSVKLIAIDGGRIELRSQSSDPAFAAPLLIRNGAPEPDAHRRAEVIGLVIGVHRLTARVLSRGR